MLVLVEELQLQLQQLHVDRHLARDAVVEQQQEELVQQLVVQQQQQHMA